MQWQTLARASQEVALSVWGKRGYPVRRLVLFIFHINEDQVRFRRLEQGDACQWHVGMRDIEMRTCITIREPSGDQCMCAFSPWSIIEVGVRERKAKTAGG